MAAATVAQKQLQTPEGETVQAWVVSAIEDGGPAMVVFTGFQASERATDYARARYAPLHFTVLAEMGVYNTRGA